MDNNGSSALYITVSIVLGNGTNTKTAQKIVAMLLNHPHIDVNNAARVKSAQGAIIITVLHIAACQGNVGIVQQLLKHPRTTFTKTQNILSRNVF